MDITAGAIAATPGLITDKPPVARAAKSHGPKSALTEVEDAADMRLIIERDEATGAYTYTTVNRRTGEVVQRLPREEVLRLGEDRSYAAGHVISANA